jgi:hypothetical protein
VDIQWFAIEIGIFTLKNLSIQYCPELRTAALKKEFEMLKSTQRHLDKGVAAIAVVLLAAFTLTSCKRPEPEDTRPCSETIKITQRNGVDVVQTVSGLYLKAKVRGFGYDCGRAPETRHLIDSGSFDMPWANGQFEPEIGPGYTKEQWDKLNLGEQATVMAPWRLHGAFVQMGIGFSNAKLAAQRKQRDQADGYFQDWWYTPAIPHKLYPLDLLPNWAVDGGPDPQAGIGPIKSKPTAYWAVRGVLDPRTKRPYTTFCSIKPPAGNKESDVAYQLNPKWLLQGETYIEDQNGNTCRGGVSADNGAYIDARLDVPGKAVPEIDKVYKAAANLLSKLIVE